MSTKILDYHQIVELQPAHSLWRHYDPAQAPLRFNAGSPQEAEDWQKTVRPALLQQIGFQNLPAVPFNPQLIEEVDKGDYVRQKILLSTAPDLLMPVYLLIPKAAARPLATVIAYHGHGYGVKDIVGLHKNGRERNQPFGYHKDFAVELVRKGFLVAAPEISCFGERQTDFTYLDKELGQDVPNSTCTHTAVMAFHLGGSVVGLRVHDSLRLVDYLQTRPDVDSGAIGAMGISGGGMATFFSTCVDPRICACVVSGYFCTFQDSILAMGHCLCNFIPGLARFGEMYDLAGLIAPRPMLVESADRDPIFPRFAVEKSIAMARQEYQVFQAADQLETDYFPGGHQISGARAYDFLKEKLAR
jgi:dienelactone hydrolase